MGLNDEKEKRDYAMRIIADPDASQDEKTAAWEFLTCPVCHTDLMDGGYCEICKEVRL